MTLDMSYDLIGTPDFIKKMNLGASSALSPSTIVIPHQRDESFNRARQTMKEFINELDDYRTFLLEQKQSAYIDSAIIYIDRAIQEITASLEVNHPSTLPYVSQLLIRLPFARVLFDEKEATYLKSIRLHVQKRYKKK